MLQIKIKHLKYLLLTFSCVSLSAFNYFNYAVADNAKTNANTACDVSIDSDCDGLTNAEEKLYTTNPIIADTDSDGYSDGVEVKSGYNPLKPAPGDKLAPTNSGNKQTGDLTSTSDSILPTTSLTDDLLQNLQTFIDTKNGEGSISTTEVQDMATQMIAAKTGSGITFDTLPTVDQASIKILNQPYGNLSETERKAKLQADGNAYLEKMTYLVFSNLPKTITTPEDFGAFLQEFMDNLSSITSSSPNTAYFADLGVRLDLFLNQVKDIEVPAAALPMHVKFLRLLQGLEAFKNEASPINDPMAQIVLLSKAQAFFKLFEDFFTNDVSSYTQSIS